MKLRLACRDYIFLLTSGQLDDEADVGWAMKLRVTQHRLSCWRCRAFTHNDAALDRILDGHKARVETMASPPEEQDGEAPGG